VVAGEVSETGETEEGAMIVAHRPARGQTTLTSGAEAPLMPLLHATIGMETGVASVVVVETATEETEEATAIEEATTTAAHRHREQTVLTNGAEVLPMALLHATIGLEVASVVVVAATGTEEGTEEATATEEETEAAIDKEPMAEISGVEARPRPRATTTSTAATIGGAVEVAISGNEVLPCLLHQHPRNPRRARS